MKRRMIRRRNQFKKGGGQKAWIRQSGREKETSTEGIPDTFLPPEQKWNEFE